MRARGYTSFAEAAAAMVVLLERTFNSRHYGEDCGAHQWRPSFFPACRIIFVEAAFMVSKTDIGADARANIFVSYSRKDAAFVDRLEAALKARGFAPKIDRSDIYAFEDWRRRIEELIVKADTIVFVLSPDSVASDVCRWEVGFAAELKKRFAPIVCRPVEPTKTPRNWRG